MSPLSLRRYRAERLLRQEFRALRAGVLSGVRARLRASTAALDEADLEASYAQAWQGLYAAVLEGQQIANPAGWLTLVTFRRALEEHRRRQRVWSLAREQSGEEARGLIERSATCCGGDDLAAELDRRIRLRQLFEALRLRLGQRELQAAALCYLQGLSRSEAAAKLGVSEARMRKLMEGAGKGRPGVAAKISALAASIEEGHWCQEQGSLMRGLAFGMLDPGGPRHRLAISHSAACPACRAYVRSLRGLAALLPPPLLPALQWAAHGAPPPLSAGAAGAHAVRGVGASVGRGSAAGQLGALPTGAGAAGGGWLLAGGPAAKLAVGCVIAIGVGAGCVSLAGHHPTSAGVRQRSAHASHPTSAHAARISFGAAPPAPALARVQPAIVGAASAASSAALSPARRAGREFGPEQALASSSASARSAPARSPAPVARAAAAAGEFSAAASSRPAATATGGQPRTSPSASASAAQREFAPG